MLAAALLAGSVAALGGAGVVRSRPGRHASRTDRWRALGRRRSSAPRWRPRGSVARSTWSAASSAAARTARPPSSATTSARSRWSRVRSMPLGAQPLDGRPCTAAGCTCTAATRARGLASPPRRCSSTTRAAIAGGGCASSPHAARGARAAVIGDRLYVAGGADDSRLAPLARDLRLPHAGAGARGPSFPGPRAQPHDRRGRRRALLRAGRARLAPTSPSAERYDPRRRRWERLPDLRFARGGIASARLPAAGSWCSAARTSSRAAPRSRQVELFDIAQAALAAAAGHAHPAPRPRRRRAWRPRLRARGRAAAGLPLLAGDRVPRRAPRHAGCDPAQGRHPDAALPDPDGADHRGLHVSSTSASRAAASSSGPAATSAWSSTARSPTRSPIPATTAG